MTTKIRTLSEQTINQIAAGEVIENPASVVKELVENAVDAGAKRIVIEIAGGGHQLIRVSDDGSGMGKEDALLCLERHATSKLQKVEDLIVLSTMGFRGEALASIASISKMQILTSVEGANGTVVEVEGGKILHVSEASRGRGTTIEVRSLFYNVPARKKFQKSAAASVAEVTKAATQLALAHVNVGFELIVQDQTIFSLLPSWEKAEGQAIADRSSQLLGSHFQSDVFEVDISEGVCALKGVIGSPLAHRHNRTGQYLFINRRPVVCPAVSYAIRDAYGTRLGADRHPIFSLHLEIPSYLIDVNVHPQKKEVRLRDERGIRSSIQMAIDLSLQRSERPQAAPIVLEEDLFCCKEEDGAQEMLSFSKQELPSHLFRQEMVESKQQSDFLIEQAIYRFIGVFSHFLFVEKQGELMLVDLHAAQRRIAFEGMLKAAQTMAVRQGLLIPAVLSVSAEEEILLHAYEEEMNKIGFDVRQCGKNKFIIEAVPPFVEMDQTLEVLRHILTELQDAELGRKSAEERLRKFAMLTSQFALGRKKIFMLQEAEGILKQLMQTSSPYYCPNGCMTMIQMSQDEIEKKFFRSV